MKDPVLVHVVDDDKAARESFVFALNAVGLRAVGYCDAEDFLARGRHEHGVLISDIRMPGLNGIDLTWLLRKEGMTMPIILMTGHGGAEMMAVATRAGADMFMTKPVDPDALVANIGQLTADWE